MKTKLEFGLICPYQAEKLLSSMQCEREGSMREPEEYSRCLCQTKF